MFAPYSPPMTGSAGSGCTSAVNWPSSHTAAQPS